jgi:hypothetical protein
MKGPSVLTAVPKLSLKTLNWGKTTKVKVRNPTSVVTRAALAPHTKPTMTAARHKEVHIKGTFGICRAKNAAMPVRKRPTGYPQKGWRHLGREMGVW